ncbi:hypothetical protein [Variovorax sp. WS11]|uniref:hypothetical protein n=1 Tax=Variovorax sp. WS11 TaxID=1105204 RepID=UPI0013D9738A|nr:hypothetical protein [Variovorax sp. WS11]NDZ17529.1 hypothetical protein [Variovorax sp. WS11]
MSALNKVMPDPEVIARLLELTIFPAYAPGPHYAEIIRRKQAAWSQVAKATGMKPQ